MIEVAAHIQRLACAGVSIMLDNLRLSGGANSVLPPGWETHGLAQPSWIEENRVHHAILCLQVFSDLHRPTSSEPAKPSDLQVLYWYGWS
jgi:hypothetical protein